jgi:hypothetical protein
VGIGDIPQARQGQVKQLSSGAAGQWDSGTVEQSLAHEVGEMVDPCRSTALRVRQPSPGVQDAIMLTPSCPGGGVTGLVGRRMRLYLSCVSFGGRQQK